ncbi:OLC1v1036311C1 [Oldenlandia corymbosa var. corymbosa]|uniref:peptidylprolyl isomerase n=1 Tax=Oldenlandia corymbosa var. corymbosa TaxID=529605 RepID=A0AAV1CV18_OLDCO|nr:OLC1v1036311C1 [Oldenlandia corymbosa var. corymbosa]
MASSLPAIFSTLNYPNVKIPSTPFQVSSSSLKSHKDFPQFNISQRDFVNGLSLMPLLPYLAAPPSEARQVEVGSYLPPSPTDPSFVVFQATPKDTPALRAGPAQCQYLKTKEHAVTRGHSKVAIARCLSAGPPDAPASRDGSMLASISRRGVLGMAIGFSNILLLPVFTEAAGLPPEEKPKLCDEDCEKELENVPMVTTESGLQYKDIKVGGGPSPPIGFQVAANYIAMVPSGQIFDSSLEKGQPYIFRVGAGQVIKGLDEGILTMKVGGKRRLYIPGSLAFPKGLTSAPGRPRVAPNSPVIFDVSLEYIPGLEVDEE